MKNVNSNFSMKPTLVRRVSLKPLHQYDVICFMDVAVKSDLCKV